MRAVLGLLLLDRSMRIRKSWAPGCCWSKLVYLWPILWILRDCGSFLRPNMHCALGTRVVSWQYIIVPNYLDREFHGPFYLGCPFHGVAGISQTCFSIG